MKLSIIIFFVGVCMVSAKYLPDDWDNSGQFLSRFKRFDLGDSDTSSEDDSDSDSNNNDSDVVTDESDIKEQSKRIAGLEKMRQKLLEKQEKERQKQEEAQRKIEEKIAKELQKEEEKREKEKRKWEEKLEKERRKLEEEQRKIQEKIVENERKRQEKIRKEMEEMEEEESGSNSSNDDSDGDNSIELEDIWKLHIYSKYGITKDNTNMEKKAALRKYMEEELGLNANSTATERRQAVLRFIQTELQSVPNINILRSQFIDYINYVGVQKIREKLEGDIEKLKNKTETLNNVNLTWAPIAKQNLAEQVSFLESIKQFLSNLLPNWVSGSTDKPQQGLPVSNADAVVSPDSSILTQETNAADPTNAVTNSSPDYNGAAESTSSSVALESSSNDLEKPASSVVDEANPTNELSVASETNSGIITAAETTTGNSNPENKQSPTETGSETVETAKKSINELDAIGVTAIYTKSDTGVTNQSENTGNMINSDVNGEDLNGNPSPATDSVNTVNNENPSETGISSTDNVHKNIEDNINQSMGSASDTTSDININKDVMTEYSKDVITEASSVVSSTLDGSVSASVPSSDLSETSLSSSINNENKDIALSTSNVPNSDNINIATVDSKNPIPDTVSVLSPTVDNGIASSALPGSDITEASLPSKPNDNDDTSVNALDLPKIDSEGSYDVNNNVSQDISNNSSTNTKENEANENTLTLNEIQSQVTTVDVEVRTPATVDESSSIVNNEQTNSESDQVQQVVNEITTVVTEQILTAEIIPQQVSTEQTLANDLKTDSVTAETPINQPVPVEAGATIVDVIKQ